MSNLAKLIGLILVVRIVSLGFPALTDPSEGRFASISQNILREGDLLSPKIFDSDRGWILYQAKPPFFMWLQALCMRAFAETAFAARLPALLGLVLTLGAIFTLSKFDKEEEPLFPAFIYLCLPLALFLGTAGITDSLLIAFTTWMGAALLLWSKSFVLSWIILAAIAAALGVMTKGPIAIALTLPPFIIVSVLNKEKLPITHILWALLVFGVITVPYFILIELHSPGFNEYFFLHENIGRYLSHDFNNRYGSVKEAFIGGSLFFLLLFTLPYPQLLRTDKLKMSYVVFAIWPAIFFAFSKQVLVTYLLPSAPWLALIMAQRRDMIKRPVWYALPSLFLCFVLVVYEGNLNERFSGKDIAIGIKSKGIDTLEMCGFFGNSILFYGSGLGLDFIPRLNNSRDDAYILVSPNSMKNFSADNIESIASWRRANLIRKSSIAP